MSTDDSNVFGAFKATVRRLQAMHAVVLLRPRDMLIHNAFDGDYDFLFDPDRFSDIVAAALKQCRRHGVSMTIEQYAPYKKRLCFICDNPDRRIQIELWPHAELTISSGAFRSLGAIDWESARPFFIDDGPYLALQPTLAAAIYITHLNHKQKSLNKPEVQRRLAYYEDALSRSDNELNKDLLSTIHALRSRTADLTAANMEAYSALVRMGVRVRILRAWPLLQRMRHRLARATAGRDGVALSPVAIIGPDGSGKTAISDALVKEQRFRAIRFKQLFRMSLLYRGFHYVRGRYAHMPRTAKNLIDESMSQTILTIALLRWWPFTISRRLSRYLRGKARSPIVVDRYFWDYLVKVRGAHARPSRIPYYHLFTKLVPTPPRAVVLCCDLETLYSRKKELSPEAIDCLYEAYCDQIARKRVKRVLALSTDGTFDRSLRQAAWFLLPDGTPMSRQSLARGHTRASPV